MCRAFVGGDKGWGKVAEEPQRTAWWGLRVAAAAADDGAGDGAQAGESGSG